MLLIAILLGLPGLAHPAPSAECEGHRAAANTVAAPYSLVAILDALRATESGDHAGARATGDRGRAIGPYQIHLAYFEDSGVVGRYIDCRDEEFARRVVLAYWRRWVPDALSRCDAQVLARVHNGGPRGASKSQTLAYWRKVAARLIQDATRPR